MSSKSTVFLSDQNEHWYYDAADDTFVLEFDNSTTDVLIGESDSEGIVLSVRSGTQMYEFLKGIYYSQRTT